MVQIPLLSEAARNYFDQYTLDTVASENGHGPWVICSRELVTQTVRGAPFVLTTQDDAYARHSRSVGG